MATERRPRLSFQQLVLAASDTYSSGAVSESTAGARKQLGDKSAPQLERRPLRPIKKVAIVDDEKAVVTIYEFVIRGLGLQLEFVAYDGTEIVDAIVKQQVHPDIIIMDHRMHRMNGLEAAMKIRAIDKSVRIILATADDSVIEKAREMGVQTIQKPFSTSRLREMLRGLT